MTERDAASLETGTFKDICRLRRDHYSRNNFTIMTDSTTVWLSEQKLGHEQTQKFEISRKMFNFLVREYQKKRKFVRK